MGLGPRVQLGGRSSFEPVWSRQPLSQDGLEIVLEILGAYQPLVGMILRIAGNHVAESWRAGLSIYFGDADPVHRFVKNIGTQLSNLFTPVTLELHRCVPEL